MNISVPSEWKVFASLFTNKIVKILSHVVNITVHSVSIIWCKLWKQFGWQLLYWNAESSTSHVCHISFQKYTLHIAVCGILIERVCFETVWIIEDMVDLQYLAVPFNYCKAKNENMVHNSGPYFIRYASLFLVSSASSSVLALYPSTMHPSSRLLILIVVWMFIHCQNL